MSEDEFMPMIPQCFYCETMRPKSKWKKVFRAQLGDTRVACSDECIDVRLAELAEAHKILMLQRGLLYE